MKISIRTVADYLTASATKQRSLIFHAKHDRGPEAQAMIHYYTSAFREIKRFHQGTITSDGLLAAADKLETDSALGSNKKVAGRMRNNARVLRDYEKNFTHLTFKLLPKPRLVFPASNPAIRVSATPDLMVEHKGRKRYVRFDFTADGFAEGVRKILAQGTFEAAYVADNSTLPGDVLVIHIATAAIHQGARMGSRLKKEIDSGCSNIAAIWPTL